MSTKDTVAARALPPDPAASTSEPAGRNYGELALSVLLLALGLYLIIDARSITIPGSSNTVGPRFFPYVVGGATVLVGALLGVRILLGDQGPAEEGEEIDPDAKTSWRAVGIITVAFLAHALLINVVGWPPGRWEPGGSSGRCWAAGSRR